MSKKQTKTTAVENPVEMINSQIKAIEKQEVVLSQLLEKQMDKITKQFDGIKAKHTKAKTKFVADKTKLKDAKVKNKQKANVANEKRVVKCEETLIDSQAKLDGLKVELEQLKVMSAQMKTLHKKNKARDKALIQVEKEWANSLNKPAKKKVVKKKAKPVIKAPVLEQKKEVMLAEAIPAPSSQPDMPAQ